MSNNILDGSSVPLTTDAGDNLVTDIPSSFLYRLVARLRLRLAR